MTKAKKPASAPSNQDLLRMYRTMFTIRTFEDQVRKIHLAGLAPGLVHLYSGQEAVAVGVCSALLPEDYIASHHRGHGHCIAKGGRLDLLFAELMGRKSGYGLGRGGSMHIYDAESRNLGTNGIVGGGVPLATGAALSAKLRESGELAVSFFGDGVLNQGIMFEAMNMASVWSLPVIYVCEDNRYGEFTETSTVTAGRQYIDRGSALGIPSENVDGMDVLAVHDAVARAVHRARKGAGPTFLVCETYRYSGHGVTDKQDYKDDAEERKWVKRDPIPKLARWLARTKRATREDLTVIEREVGEAVKAALESAKRMPEPTERDLMDHVYA